MIQYLIDEILLSLYEVQLKRYFSELRILMIGNPNTPEEHGIVLQ